MSGFGTQPKVVFKDIKLTHIGRKYTYSTACHKLAVISCQSCHKLPLFSGPEKTTYGDLLWFQKISLKNSKVGKRFLRFIQFFLQKNSSSTIAAIISASLKSVFLILSLVTVIPNSSRTFWAILELENPGWSLFVRQIHCFSESFNLLFTFLSILCHKKCMKSIFGSKKSRKSTEVDSIFWNHSR